MPYLRVNSPMRRRRRALGDFPDSPCYDPNRPGWLPYVLNDSNEQACAQAAMYRGGVIPSTWDAIKQLFAPSQLPTPVVTPPTIGTPVGYDPNTGIVDPTNTSGQTSINPGSVLFPGDAGGGSADASGGSSSIFMWIVIGLGIAVIADAFASGGGRRR